jgi:hypothetical protein
MLRDVKNLIGFAIEATDGALGHVRDVYFDDEAWVIRYLVVDTGKWLANRNVLVSPTSMDEPMWTLRKLPVRLTREQVRASPGVDTDKPVSRQHESQFGRYYGYPNYWGSTGLWGAGYYLGAGRSAGSMSKGQGDARMAQLSAQESDGDSHLRSGNVVIGYQVHATDGDIGHVQGLLVDEAVWAIRYLIIDTSNWWLGHRVLVAPEWITEVSWRDLEVRVDLSRVAIQQGPHWDPALQPDCRREVLVHRHAARASDPR